MKRFLVALLALSVPALLGCGGDELGGECTLIGCADGLTIEFLQQQPGAYTVELVADGETITCNATLPLPACSELPSESCSRSDVTLFQSGCGLEPLHHSINGVSFTGNPSTVEIRVERDGTEVASDTFEPAYQRSAPNGEECGPICNNATVTLSP
jgi:hypothetical protein